MKRRRIWEFYVGDDWRICEFCVYDFFFFFLTEGFQLFGLDYSLQARKKSDKIFVAPK